APAPARPYVNEVGAPVEKLRIGVCAQNLLSFGEVHPDCVQAAHDAATLLESLGHTVENEFPAALVDDALLNQFTTLWAGNLVYVFRYWERKLGRELTADDVEPLTWTLAELGRSISAGDYIDAKHAALELGR